MENHGQIMEFDSGKAFGTLILYQAKGGFLKPTHPCLAVTLGLPVFRSYT